jgi:hypothetical protein
VVFCLSFGVGFERFGVIFRVFLLKNAVKNAVESDIESIISLFAINYHKLHTTNPFLQLLSLRQFLTRIVKATSQSSQAQQQQPTSLSTETSRNFHF